MCYEAVKSNAFTKLRKFACITLQSPAAETLKTLPQPTTDSEQSQAELTCDITTD